MPEARIVELSALHQRSRRSDGDEVTVTDPRVYFAAERTLLAWVRSGITVIALGFVVARFGLFLSLISVSRVPVDATHHDHWASSTLGIGLVILGVVTILGALQNHRVYVRCLPVEDLPKLPIPWLGALLALAMVALGVLLAVYLVIA